VRTSAACSCCRASGFDSGQRSTEHEHTTMTAAIRHGLGVS
jgi:hypothetical protein